MTDISMVDPTQTVAADMNQLETAFKLAVTKRLEVRDHCR